MIQNSLCCSESPLSRANHLLDVPDSVFARRCIDLWVLYQILVLVRPARIQEEVNDNENLCMGERERFMTVATPNQAVFFFYEAAVKCTVGRAAFEVIVFQSAELRVR